MRRTALAACLCLSLLAVPPAFAAPVSFRGLACDATGSASALVWSPRSNVAELRCTGIGSSGQDGISVLTGDACDEWSFDFGPVPDGASPPDEFTLALLESTDPAATPFLSWTQAMVAGRVRCTTECPEAVDWVVQVWSGDDLEYSEVLLSPPVVELPAGVSMCEVMVSAGMSGGLALSSARDIETKLKSLGLLGVNGLAVSGDRVRVTARCAMGKHFAKANLTGRFGGGGGGGAGGFSVRAHSARFGIGGTAPSPPLGFVVNDGALLEKPPSPNDEASVTRGPGMPDWRVSLLDLSRPAAPLHAWGMDFEPVTALELAAGAELECRVPSLWSNGPDTLRIGVSDPGTGTGPALDVTSGDTSKTLDVGAYSGSFKVTIAPSAQPVPPGALRAAAAAQAQVQVPVGASPSGFHVVADGGDLLVRCPMPAGTVVFSGGMAWPCDSIEVRVAGGSGETCDGALPPTLLGRGIDKKDIRRGMLLRTNQHTALGGVAVNATGDATVQPLGGGVVIHGMSVTGGDGVVFDAPGGAARVKLKDTFQNGDIPAGQDFTALAPLAGGGAEEVSSLALVQSAGPTGTSLRAKVHCVHRGEGRLFVQLSDGSVVEPEDCDDDGDGWMDFRQLLGGATSMVGSVSYRRDSPWTECFDITFNGTAVVKVHGDDRYLIGLRVWRNRGGEHVGTPAPAVSALRHRCLPPGEPVIGDRGVCGLEVETPQVQTAGAEIEAHGAGSAIGGYPVVETWCTLSDSGGVDCDDKDSDPGISLRSRTGGPVVIDKRYPEPGPLGPVTRGAAFTADFSAADARSAGAGFEVGVGGTAGGTPDALLIAFLSRKGYEYYKNRGSMTSLGSNPLYVRCYSGGALTAEFPQPDSIELTRAPGAVCVGDLDGDGAPEIVCTNFAPGAQVHPPGGGPDQDCDRMVITPIGPVEPFALDGSAVARLNGLPPGVPVTGLRLATIPAGDPTLDVPLAGPARAFGLSRPWPNPARGALRAAFSLPAASRVRARVLDVAGRLVATLADARFAAGDHVLAWDGRTSAGAAAPAGVYFLRVERDGRETLNARFTQLR